MFQEKAIKTMKVLMLIVADHASVEPSTGKLNILGAFRQIQAAAFPTQHPAMSVVTKIGGEYNDKPNPHTLSISLTDEDGHELLNISGPFDMPRADPGIQPEFNTVIELRGIVFPHPNTYSFVVRIDDEDELTEQTAIQVVLKPQKAQE